MFRGYRPPPLEPLAADVPGLAEIARGTPDAETLARVFPPVRSYTAGATALAVRTKFFKRFQALAELNVAAEPGRSIRLAGSVPGSRQRVFDLFSDGRRLCVHAQLAGATFEGDLASGEASPFERVFGVDPVALGSLLAIGQRLAAGRPYWIPGPDTVLAYPADDDPIRDGLRRVEFDAATGLPRRAEWSRGGRGWTAHYVRWTYAPVGRVGDARPWLLPSRVVVEHRAPKGRVEIEVRAFNAIDPPPNPKRFACPETPAGTPTLPLSELEKALRAF